MDFFHALILSVVEGLTEFLPISSTGHLILVSKLLNIPQTDFAKTFEIVIQAGAILAVLFLYGKTLLKNRQVLKRVIWAFIPTGIVGFLLYKLIKSFLIGNFQITLTALLAGGVLIILLEKFFKKHEGKATIEKLTIKQAVYVGLIQAISVIPGVSRSAATIFGGMLVGLSREAAVEMSFMLAIPTMLAATALDLVKSRDSFQSGEMWVLILGVLASFLVAIAAIRWFIGFVKRSDLSLFGVYRIIVALTFLLILR